MSSLMQVDQNNAISYVEYTIHIDFSAGVHEVICIKMNIGVSLGQYLFFWCISHHVHQLKSP